MSVPDGRSQEELLQDLREGSLDDFKPTLKRLALIGEAEALDAVIEFLADHPEEAHAEGIETLTLLAHKFMPDDRYRLAEVLIPALRSEEWAMRLSATRLLNAHPNELAVDALRDLIEESREKVIAEQRRRISAVRLYAERTLAESILALAHCGRLYVLPEILELLEEPGLRAIATRAIGIIGSDTERMRLEDLIEDPDVQVRDAAQWALGLMDERETQFMLPPEEQPEPPPDRLSPVYWMHRQLYASDDDLVQFLVVRIAIEHLLLDGFITEGRMLEECTLTLRRYDGDTPPDFRTNRSEVIGQWTYYLDGPDLIEEEEPSVTPQPRRPSITISYPASLEEGDEGLVSFDCLYGPLQGRGWIYRVHWQDDGWGFVFVRNTWVS